MKDRYSELLPEPYKSKFIERYNDPELLTSSPLPAWVQAELDRRREQKQQREQEEKEAKAAKRAMKKAMKAAGGKD